MQGSLQKLEAANVDLQQASARLNTLREDTIKVDSKVPISVDYNWLWGFVFGGLVIAIFFLMKRRREDF